MILQVDGDHFQIPDYLHSEYHPTTPVYRNWSDYAEQICRDARKAWLAQRRAYFERCIARIGIQEEVSA